MQNWMDEHEVNLCYLHTGSGKLHSCAGIGSHSWLPPSIPPAALSRLYWQSLCQGLRPKELIMMKAGTAAGCSQRSANESPLPSTSSDTIDDPCSYFNMELWNAYGFHVRMFVVTSLWISLTHWYNNSLLLLLIAQPLFCIPSTQTWNSIIILLKKKKCIANHTKISCFEHVYYLIIQKKKIVHKNYNIFL